MTDFPYRTRRPRRSSEDVTRTYHPHYIDRARAEPPGDDAIEVISPVTERPARQITSATAVLPLSD